MNKEQFMAMSQNTGLMCKVSYLEDGILTSTKIKPVSGFSVEKTDVCSYMIRFGYADKIEFRTEKTFKPILYPFSDITKEILHNGKNIIPYIELLRESAFSVDTMTQDELDYFKGGWSMIELLSLSDALLLIEWHFDIAGLIEKGEAIDINTIENPYK